ncbi:response regulator [Gramella sp. AN32]|uniref:Response regulator n=1 Tax=Christiangramia antarctica TaxID=2058158 RepID=A0ABW5X8G6_9FLAO|nr:response regulator [Gramella sp. AN32]MCM4156452.1 response regulator [Gramella sp. AN32]
MKHVLLIDDNEIDSYIAKHIITKSKMAQKINVQNSAIDALEFLGTLKNNPEEFPDNIFLDIQMPEMNGFGFLEEFKKFSESIQNQCRVIMLTSSNDPKDIDRSFQYPFVKKFLTKPLVLRMLEDLKKTVF